jgi:hypothetical protein
MNTKRSFLEEAAANESGATSVEAISGMGWSSKSHTSRVNKPLPLFLLICLFAIINYSIAPAQTYIWPPKSEGYFLTSILQGKDVSIEIKDTRVIVPSSKVEVSFEQISNEILRAITQTYGKSFINNKSEKKVLILVQAYDVTFYTGMWHAQTRYAVRIDEEEEYIIEQTNNLFNVWGYRSGKKVLTKSFTGANLKLFQFLNENLR